ncbi:hypothetical protein H5410_028042 [Solanum commersonii]|uniref:Uncharacterized protein n=1 Tax=Solanum commersonii TaxID=4109 RepID=A0A9J5Z6B5_SOLCO|nr:hypothetical protein H5410_028042 [Solanum commersonii]
MIKISSKNYMDWFNSKDKGSIIYIAFGSYSKISSQLMEEIGHGLLKCGRHFFGRIGKDKTEKRWRTTYEVPIVACPLWIDEVCNAKLIQDIWKNGVRVIVREDGVIERDEFKKCITIEMGSGEEGEELRRNVNKWSDLAKEAMKENGTSSVNLKAFASEFLLGHNEY